MPVYSLLGGKTRDRIETAAYLFYRYKSDDGIGGEDSPEAMVERARELARASRLPESSNSKAECSRPSRN